MVALVEHGGEKAPDLFCCARDFVWALVSFTNVQNSNVLNVHLCY